MTTDKPLPVPDRDSLPFWQGVRAGVLRVQRCSGCGTLRWPARAICNRCRSFDAEWVPASGRGNVVSWVRTHQPFAKSFQGEIPYTVILVRLAEQEDLQMIGRFAAPDIAPAPDMAVRAVFPPAPDEERLVFWEPAE